MDIVHYQVFLVYKQNFCLLTFYDKQGGTAAT